MKEKYMPRTHEVGLLKRGLRKRGRFTALLKIVAGFLLTFVPATNPLEAQSTADPTMLVPNLSVRTVIDGLSQPTTMAFLGENDFLVLEKATGKVQRVVNGVVQGAVLDLAVNSASERGLLGIALHPQFSVNGFVYLFWTESTTGVDTSNIDEIPLLGNRVDRYV